MQFSPTVRNTYFSGQKNPATLLDSNKTDTNIQWAEYSKYKSSMISAPNNGRLLDLD